MPRCESCGGSIQGMFAASRPRDKCIDVNLFEFTDDVGRRTAKRTHFCSEECAVRGIEEGLLLTHDDSMFYCDRHGEGPNLYPDAEVEPLIRRAKELLEEAADLNNCDDLLGEYLDRALTEIDGGQDVLDGYPDTEYRCKQAAQSALVEVEEGEVPHDAVERAAVKHGVPKKRGRVYGLLQEVLPEDAE